VAYHFHWPYEQIMNLEHLERLKWIEEIAQINRRLNDAVKSESTELFW
jgi:hypothetical protein